MGDPIYLQNGESKVKNVNCSNCGQEMPQKAPVCAKCGNPNKKANHLSGKEALLFMAPVAPLIWWLTGNHSFSSLLAIVVFGMVVTVIVQSIITSNKKKAMEKHLVRINDFSATQRVMGSNSDTGLAIDEQRKKICLIDHRLPTVSLRVISYKDLLSSELFEDGTSVTKTVRSSQIGGVLIGSLALGGVGAILGGLSGKTQTSEKINKIDLRLTINDTQSPLHDVSFLNVETKKDGLIYQQAMQQARHWHGLIEVLIKRAETEDNSSGNNITPQIQSSSIADEIKKLADLRDSGVLSVDEFQQQKARLLGSGA